MRSVYRYGNLVPGVSPLNVKRRDPGNEVGNMNGRVKMEKNEILREYVFSHRTHLRGAPCLFSSKIKIKIADYQFKITLHLVLTAEDFLQCEH